jgi:RNA polymerase sigma-70 factor, ECF subfamily
VNMDKKIENIFHQFYSPLCNYAYKIVKDDFIAEEVVQSLFIQLFEKIDWSKIRHIEPYLLRCVKFKCIDYLRKEPGYKTTDIKELQNQSIIGHQEITEDDIEPLFHYYAAKLPSRTREVFLLSRQGGLTYKEIAEELNISVKTVEVQMSRAIKKMKELLKNLPLLLGFL